MNPLRSFPAFTLLTGALVLAACNDPSKDAPRAAVSAPVAAVTSAPPAGAAETLRFSNADSKLEFVGSKVTRSHSGSFTKFSGSVQLVDGDLTKSSLSVEIDMSELTTDDGQLTGHLKSPDFFDVGKFPTASFQSTQVVAGGDHGATHTITGNLKLHGVEKSISFPATLGLSGDRLSAKAEFPLTRKDFDINYPGKVDDLIRDGVVIMLEVSAARAAK